jgi:DNA polymerase III delta prime subunit
MVGAIYLLVMSVLLYNPDRKDKQEFISEFVIRTEIFEELRKDIKSGKMTTPEQHYLLLGQRGAGKTTMLLRLKYAVEDDPKLSKWLIPVIFSEEQYNISELGNLWEKIAEYLEDYHAFTGITEEMTPFIQQDNYEEALFRILIKHLDLHKKKIVLLIDNIGQLLAKFEELEVRRLREILQTIPHLRLIAGSPVVLESVLDYQQPLFEFFKMIQLKGLTNEESIALLRQLAVIHHEEEKIERIIKNSPERISTLRTLSGGVPRTMSLLFQIFVDNEHGSALSDLEKVLDAVTPLYKHRMDDLPPQQQKIVDAVALHWEAISVKDLAKQVRLDSKLISAQLRQLEKNQIIEKRATNTKNHIYLLRERFFNIWYLMRYGRKQDRNRVIWLVKFLESWCDKSEIEKRIQDYAHKAKNRLLDKHTLELYGQAYAFFQDIDIETKYLLRESIPTDISKNVSIAKDDFLHLLDKALSKKDYDTFVKIAEHQHEWDMLQRQKICDYIIDHKADIEERVLKNFKKTSTGKLDPKQQFPYLYWIVLLFLIKENIVEAAMDENHDWVKSFTMYFAKLLQLANLTELTPREERVVRQIILILLAGKYYQLALKMLDIIPLPDLQLDIFKKTSYYMESGQDNKNVFLSWGSEFQESVEMLSKEILHLRTYINK